MERQQWLQRLEEQLAAQRGARQLDAAREQATQAAATGGWGFDLGAWLGSIQLNNEQQVRLRVQPHGCGCCRSLLDNPSLFLTLQAWVLRTVPLLGPVVGSAFIIGLYLLARLVKVRSCGAGQEVLMAGGSYGRISLTKSVCEPAGRPHGPTEDDGR